MSDAKNETTAPFADIKTVQDINTVYFDPSKLSDGVAFVEHISTLTSPIFNFDPNGTEFPATHGMLILPIGETQDVLDKEGKKTGEKERVTKHVVVAAVPTLDALLSDDKGKEYVERSAQAAFAAKIRNTLVRAKDVGAIKLPLSLEEFITSERGAADQGLQAFKVIAPAMVKALANNKIDTNVMLLRQCLQSASFAQALMPKVSQKVWVKVLETAKKQATEKKLKTDIFDHWLETRDQASNETAVEDIDL